MSAHCRSRIASQAVGAIASGVSTKFITAPLAVTAAMLAFTSAGGAWSRGVAVDPAVVSAPMQDQTAASLALPWWQQAGDPFLGVFVKQGLESNEEIACRVSGLRYHDILEARETRRFGARLGKLLGADQQAKVDARARTREDRVQRVVARRIRVSRQIALAYVEVRRLQQEIALRSGLRDQYKDNVEVAQFRREAGLVSAIDGALARSQDEAAQGELDYAQSRLNNAIDQLARLIGDTPEALARKLEAPGSTIDALAAAIPTDGPYAVLMDNVQREARLAKALDAARRTVRDAREAYRRGAGEYTTLYVAETAVTAVDLALRNAKASRVTAALELWSGQDAAWARNGLDPVANEAPARDATITVMADCD
jgi:hypothetical protein